MFIATALFLLLLAAAHLGDPEAVDRPLSLFREQRPAIGYPLFGLLAVVSALHLRTYCRQELRNEVFAPAVSAVLLAVVALTPSPAAGHTLAALGLLAFVFGWYALRLYRTASPWLLVHLAAPVLVLAVTEARSYGIWQKVIVVYFLITANIDCLLVTGRLNLPGPDDFKRRPRRRVAEKYAPRVIWKRNDEPPR